MKKYIPVNEPQVRLRSNVREDSLPSRLQMQANMQAASHLQWVLALDRSVYTLLYVPNWRNMNISYILELLIASSLTCCIPLRTCLDCELQT